MTRLPNLTDRDSLSAALQESYDAVAAERNGAVSGPFGILLHSPELAIRGARLGSYVRFQSELSAVDRETAIITTGHHFEAEVEWVAHSRLAREAGVREAVIEAVDDGGSLEALTDEESQIVSFVRELLDVHRVSEETFESVRGRLGDRGIVELTGLVGYYSFVACTLNAFEVTASTYGL